MVCGRIQTEGLDRVGLGRAEQAMFAILLMVG